ncbi:hypothetical protein ACHAQH_010058 [Verticillium albo-atrum]
MSSNDKQNEKEMEAQVAPPSSPISRAMKARMERIANEEKALSYGAPARLLNRVHGEGSARVTSANKFGNIRGVDLLNSSGRGDNNETLGRLPAGGTIASTSTLSGHYDFVHDAYMNAGPDGNVLISLPRVVRTFNNDQGSLANLTNSALGPSSDGVRKVYQPGSSKNKKSWKDQPKRGYKGRDDGKKKGTGFASNRYTEIKDGAGGTDQDVEMGGTEGLLKKRQEMCAVVGKGDEFSPSADKKQCINCLEDGHEASQCIQYCDDGFMHCCTLCNALHRLDDCPKFKLLSQVESVHELVTKRARKAPMATTVNWVTRLVFVMTSFQNQPGPKNPLPQEDFPLTWEFAKNFKQEKGILCETYDYDEPEVDFLKKDPATTSLKDIVRDYRANKFYYQWWPVPTGNPDPAPGIRGGLINSSWAQQVYKSTKDA